MSRVAHDPAVAGEPGRAVLREAAQWLVRLHSSDAGPEDWQALARWRAQDAAHEQAWQRAERLSRTLGAVPFGLGLPVLNRAHRGVNRRAALRVLAFVGVAPATAYLGWRHLPWQPWAAEHRTATGEQRTVLLADGSQLLLNTATAVDVAWDVPQPRVRLHAGEMLVTTAPDVSGARPTGARSFQVETPQGVLRALGNPLGAQVGTRFAVRLGEAGETRVALAQGTVEVAPRQGLARVLRAGAQCHYTATAVSAPLPLGEQALAWAQGVLYADNLRLDAFARELSRYRPGLLHCDPAVAGLRISGAFQLRNTDQALAMVAATLPVQVLSRTRYWVTLLPG